MSAGTDAERGRVVWPQVPLIELVDPDRGISYGIVQPGKHVDGGIPVVRVKNLVNGQISLSNVIRVSPEVESAYGRTRLRGGELLLSLVGTLGQTAIVSRYLTGWNVARAVGVIPIKDQGLTSWVNYCLQSLELQQWIISRANTTVQATLNLADVKSIPIPLPPETERNRVVDILGALDKKIELNRQMNKTLDEIARTLFRAWFVDFDPVRAKMEGRQPDGMDSASAALFPDRLIDSELGPIPEGWEVKPLDEIGEFLNGLALQKYPPRGNASDLPVIKIAQLRAQSTENSARANNEVPERFVIEDGDFLFSWSGSLMAEIWTGGTGALNQHLFKVTSEYPQWFIYNWVQIHLEEFRAIAADKATTMGHINRRHLSEAKCVVPVDPAPFNLGDEVIGQHLALALNNSLESRVLAELRYTLLPELLAGQVLS